jgi:hypothetical protein
LVPSDYLHPLPANMSIAIPNAIKPQRYKTRSPKQSLVGLPVEVKTLIYEEVFENATSGYTQQSRFFARGYELLLTNKTIYNEGIDLYYKNLTFETSCRPLVLRLGKYYHLPASLAPRFTPSNAHPLRMALKIQKLRLAVDSSMPVLPPLPRCDSLRQITMVESRSYFVHSKADIATQIKVQETISASVDWMNTKFKAWKATFANRLDVKCEWKLACYRCHSEEVVRIQTCFHYSKRLTLLHRQFSVTWTET